MQVAQYTFQSPYSSPVQVGRLDPNSIKEDASSGSRDTSFTKSQTQREAQTQQSTMKQEVKPIVNSGNRLDIYA